MPLHFDSDLGIQFPLCCVPVDVQNVSGFETFWIRDTHPVSPSDSVVGLGQGTRVVSLGLHQSLAAAGLEGVTLLRGGHLASIFLAAQSGQRQDTSVWLSSGPRLLSYLFLFQLKARVLDQRQ